MRRVLFLLAAGVGLVSLPDCAEPTAIVVEVYSEVPCATNAGVVLAGGPSLANLDPAVAASTATRCDPDALGMVHRGNVVLVPGADRSAPIAFSLATRNDDRPVETACAKGSPDAAGCIVAKRQLRFLPGTTVNVRVDLRLSCLGVTCTENDTCVRGACVPATVTTSCKGGCDETTLTPDGGVVDAGTDGGDAGVVLPGRLALGSTVTCFRKVPEVYCWGTNASGQVSGLADTYPTPVAIPSLSGATAITAGASHTCAIVSGKPYCWGKKESVGFVAPADVRVPTLVKNENMNAIATRTDHTCMLEGNEVFCFGLGTEGQLGNGSTSSSVTPFEFNVPSAVAVATGLGHTCLLSATGTVSCFGRNVEGQLGNGTTTPSLTPVAIPNFDAKQISGGAAFNCAIRANGSVWCWGYNAQYMLGDGSQINRPSPVVVGLPGTAKQICTGGGHACAVLQSGALACWGYNNAGQQGDGTQTDVKAPKLLTGLGGPVVEVGCGATHTCAVTASGKLYCWGSGLIGDGSLTNVHTTPVEIPIP